MSIVNYSLIGHGIQSEVHLFLAMILDNAFQVHNLFHETDTSIAYLDVFHF